LDHRQLLTVNFTGVVATDFPATQQPGVVTILDSQVVSPPSQPVKHPGIPLDLQPIVKVSGFDISGIATSYDSKTDTLSVGLIQPKSGTLTNGINYPVIAGDADNNGDSGTVNPLINNPNYNSSLPTSPANMPGIRQGDFEDPADLSASETMGAFLNFSGPVVDPLHPDQPYYRPDFVAGFANNGPSNVPKHYEVAPGIDNGPGNVPDFGFELPSYEGNYYLVNDPRHGAFQFEIKKFSELYKSITHTDLTSQSVVRIGAFGSSNQDDGISEGLFPAQPFKIADATPPPQNPCPPASPPVLINPHSSRHINTAHGETVRVTIQSTSGFDATQIDPATVRLGGATPFTNFTRNFNHSDFPSQTFVFRGYDISLPGGITPATVTGQLRDGTKFSTTQLVFNRNDMYYTPAQIAARDAKLGFQPPEEVALDVASANANGDLNVINANILQANALAAVAAQTIPSDDLAFAPAPAGAQALPQVNLFNKAIGVRNAVAPAAAFNEIPVDMTPAVSTPAAKPSTVSIRHRGHAAAKGKVPTAHMRSAAAFQRAGLNAKTMPASTASATNSSSSSAISAQDAALASMYSS
jgi:hypothetical protein